MRWTEWEYRFSKLQQIWNTVSNNGDVGSLSVIESNRLRWAIRLPGYSMLRLFRASDSAAELRYHQKRRVKSLAAACGAAKSEVLRALQEAASSDTLIGVKNGMKELPWQGAFRAAQELFVVCRLIEPSVVVETGVGTGYSSAHILAALELNQKGRLVSIDLPNADPSWKLIRDSPPGFLVPERLRARWKLLLGSSSDLLPGALADAGKIDVFMHDSEHSYETMSYEFNTAWPDINPGGILISDDALWNPALLELASREHRRIGFLYHSGGSAPVAYVTKPE